MYKCIVELFILIISRKCEFYNEMKGPLGGGCITKWVGYVEMDFVNLF